jgi:hypothetical protein
MVFWFWFVVCAGLLGQACGLNMVKKAITVPVRKKKMKPSG